MSNSSKTELKDQDRIPLFRTWKAWYLTVAGVLLALISLFAYLTQRYS